MRNAPDTPRVAAARECLRADRRTRPWAKIRRSLDIPHVSVVKCYATKGDPIPPEHLARIEAYYLSDEVTLDEKRTAVLAKIVDARHRASDREIGMALGISFMSVARWARGSVPQRKPVERAYGNLHLLDALGRPLEADLRGKAGVALAGAVAEEATREFVESAASTLSGKDAANVIAWFVKRVSGLIKEVTLR